MEFENDESVSRTNPLPMRIKQARLIAGFTQKELGIRIGMSEDNASSRMNHYEKGRNTPDIVTLQKMADELNVPLHYFFCEDEATAELACLFDRCAPEDRKKIIDLVKQLLPKK